MNAKTSKLYRKFVKTLNLPHGKVRNAYQTLKRRHVAANYLEKAVLTAGMRGVLAGATSK